jgi:DNA modification methylase
VLEASILVGDAVARLRELPDGVARTCVTSPPYWGLRDYGNDRQLGLEGTPQEFVENLCLVFDEVWRVLADDGTVWVNLGDSYASHSGMKQNRPQRDNSGGLVNNLRDSRGEQSWTQGTTVGVEKRFDVKPKDLVGIPWRFAFAMQDRGWYLRQDIIWAKPNPMPESVTDRCTKSHEYVFLLSKQPKYFFDNEAIREPATTKPTMRDRSKENYQDSFPGGRFSEGERVFGSDDLMKNKRSVWTVNTKGYKEAHFAVYPPALIEPCIKAGSAEGDTVLDPFSGSGTTGEVALQNGRNYVGIELNPDYAALSEKRINNAIGMLGEVRVESC